MTQKGKTYYKSVGNQTSAFDKSVGNHINLVRSYDKERDNLYDKTVAIYSQSSDIMSGSNSANTSIQSASVIIE